ncbi:hypothetical protein [Halobellus litoreus]|uniref:Uncharacterized protein n=1 Tax=Halobellus litoreus TaxID=755310 RepID=A0ABD6DTP7_9EURY|nr:hypothetical protein [Halobellus litoreus]
MIRSPLRAKGIEYFLYLALVLAGGALLLWLVLDYFSLIEAVVRNAPW